MHLFLQIPSDDVRLYHTNVGRAALSSIVHYSKTSQYDPFRRQLKNIFISRVLLTMFISDQIGRGSTWGHIEWFYCNI